MAIINTNLLLSCLMLLSFHSLSAQSAWERVTGVPQENGLRAIVKIPGTQRLLAVGEGSTVMLSSDSATSWQLLLNPGGLNNQFKCMDVCFLDSLVGFICGSEQTILKSSDSGKTWRVVYASGSSKMLHQLAFATPTHGFAIGEDKILLRTTDGGVSWVIQVLPPSDGLFNIAFADSLTGFITTWSDSSLFKTYDGGITWLSLPLPTGLPSMFIDEIRFVNDTLGYLGGSSGEITKLFRTTDKGLSWVEVYTGWPTGLGGKFLFFDDQNMLYALPTYVEYTTFILSSKDGGMTWEENLHVGLDDLDMTSACTLNDHTAVAVGLYGTINKSNNKGIAWVSASHKMLFDEIYQVQFVNKDVGFVATCPYRGGVAESSLMRTDDGGDTWKSIEDWYFYHGCFNFVDADTGYVASWQLSATVHKTTDGGNTWEASETGIEQEPEIIKFYNSQDGLLGLTYKLLRTNDGGINWQEITPGSCTPYDIRDIEYRSATKVFAVADQQLWASADGGFTWECIEVAGLSGANDIFFATDSIGFIAAYNSIYKTVDAGATWAQTFANPAHTIWFNAVNFPSPTIGYAVGEGDYENIFKTTDAGQTWKPLPLEATSNLVGVYFSEPDSGLVFAKPGALFKTTCGGSLSIEETLPISGGSVFTVFPNPANESVVLRFREAIAPSGATLQLLDGAGKVAQTYAIQPGAKQAQLNVGLFAKGIYVLRLIGHYGKTATSQLLLKK